MQMALTEEESDFDAILIVHVVVVSDVGAAHKFKKDIRYPLQYRPGQPNWKYTMWKFQDFSGTQILREINFRNFKRSKTAVFAIL